MVKKTNKRVGKLRSKTSKKQKQLKKMYGGMFNEASRAELGQLGFSNQDITLLETNIPNISLIRGSLEQVNPQTGSLFTPQELMQGLHDAMNETNNISDIDSFDNENNLNISGISNVSDDDHFLDETNDLNASFMNDDETMNTTRDSVSNLNGSNDNLSFQSNGSLHLSDLDDSDNQYSINTTREENSFGGKKRKTIKKRNTKKSKKHTKKNMPRQNKKNKGHSKKH